MSLLVVFATSTPAAGQVPVRTHLVSQRADGADSCPDELGIRAAVVARLGYDAFADDAPTETAVTWWRDPSGTLHSRVVRTGPGGAPLGSRTLESAADDCAELASATSFAIAVAIDPTAAERDPTAPIAPAPPPTAPASPPPPPPPPGPSPTPLPAPPVAASTPPEPWKLVPFIGAAAQVAILAAPAAAASGAIHAGIRIDWFSIAVEGRFDVEARGADAVEALPGVEDRSPDQAAPREVSEASEVGSRLTLVSLVPCGHVGPAAFCAVGAVGELAVQGYGVDRPESDSALVGAFGPRVGLELPLIASRLGIFAEGGMLFVLPRATVELDDEPAYEESLAHVVLGGGLRLHLGALGKSARR